MCRMHMRLVDLEYTRPHPFIIFVNKRDSHNYNVARTCSIISSNETNDTFETNNSEII